MAAALRPKKRASRKQMFQMVLRISAANRAAETRQEDEISSARLRPRRLYKRACAVRLLWCLPDLHSRHCYQLTSFSLLRSTADPAAGLGLELWLHCEHTLKRDRSRLYRCRRWATGAFQAPTAPCSVDSPHDRTTQRVCIGRGDSAPMIPGDKPGCWRVLPPTLHQSPHDPGSWNSGLEQPPRTATSIPVGSQSCCPLKPRTTCSPHSGLPPSLAAGGDTVHYMSGDPVELLLHCAQGWEDCYQDPHHCAVCQRFEAYHCSPRLRLISIKLQTCYLGCHGHPLRQPGFIHVQVGYSSAFSSPPHCPPGGTPSELGTPVPRPSSMDMPVELPKEPAENVRICRAHSVCVVNAAGMPETLATRHGGLRSQVHVVETYAAAVSRLLRLTTRPSSRTTWETRDVQAAVGITIREPALCLGSGNTSLLGLTLEIRCLEKLASPRWTWKVWTSQQQQRSRPRNFETSHLWSCYGQEKEAPAHSRVLEQNHHTLCFQQSHPGPKAGGRPYTLVHYRTQDQSTGVRVTGDCHSPVGPKDPRVGSDGKPWHEQHTQLVFVGTAQEGSLRWWPTPGRQAMTIFHQDAQMLHGTQLSATKRAESGMTVIYAALDSQRSYMFSTCERKPTYYLVYMSRVPIRLLGPVAPALYHLTWSMAVQRTRSSCCRPSLVGTSLSVLPQTVCRAPSSAPGSTTHSPVSIRPTRRRYPLASQAAGPDRLLSPRAFLRPRCTAQDPDSVTGAPECCKLCVFFSLALFQRLEGP